MAGKFDDVHKKLLSLQYIDCRSEIPDSVIGVIKRYEKTPPDIAHMSTKINKIVEPLRLNLIITMWAYSRVDKAISDEVNLFNDVFDHMLNYATDAVITGLRDLMLDKSHAFTSKQKQQCRAILTATDELIGVDVIARVFNQKGKRAEYQGAAVAWIAEYYESKWLKVLREANLDYMLPDVLEIYLGIKNRTYPEFDQTRDGFYATVENVYGKKVRLESESIGKFENFYAHHAVEEAYNDNDLVERVWSFIESKRE